MNDKISLISVWILVEKLITANQFYLFTHLLELRRVGSAFVYVLSSSSGYATIIVQSPRSARNHIAKYLASVAG